MGFNLLCYTKSVGIYAQIIYLCDFVNKINNQNMHKSMSKYNIENRVKLIDQMNAQWQIQN